MTAAHNFEYMKACKSTNTIESHHTLPPDFKLKGNRYFKPDGCWAVYFDSGKNPFMCNIRHLNYIENYDVAVFTAHGEDESLVFPHKISIDLAMPQIGDEVVILGNLINEIDKKNDMLTISKSLQMWAGVVTNLAIEKSRLGQTVCFETTIPILPGMSGSPVIKKPRNYKGDMVVCGIASSDFSDSNALKSFYNPGCSTVSALWPSMGLGFQMNIAELDKQVVLLDELRPYNILNDKTNGVKVTVIHDQSKCHILYEDNRVNPPSSILLTTNKHPLK